MASPSRVSPSNRLLVVAACALVVACSQAVMMANETEQGGVVTYLYKEDRGGPMGSLHRREALRAMEKKCPAGYRILRDGAVQGYSSLSAVEGMEGEAMGRRWGIQFACKGAP